MQNESSLARLIKRRSQELGLDAQALGLRLGYQNPAKAAGRVHALCDGHIFSRKSRGALSRLANALEVSENVVQDALVATEALMAELERQAAAVKRQAIDADAARWRMNFRPHAVIETVRRCPSQIVICGLTGGIGRWLIVPVDPSSAPITFVRQVLDALPDKLRTGPSGQKGVPFFGQATGFILNYSPDRAVRFTLNGEALETIPKAYRPGEVELSIGGGRRSPLTTARVLGLA
jgi:hypothetical protein